MTRKNEQIKFFFSDIMRSPETAMCWLFSGKSGTGNMVRKEKAFISITIWRWVTVIKGEGVIKLENGDYPYFPQTFTMIPEKTALTRPLEIRAGSILGNFFFIDVERFLTDLLSGTKPPGRGDQQENQQWRKISDPWKKSGSR